MKTVHYSDDFQEYTYVLTAREGTDFDARFKPQLTPKEMLELGVFGGNYFKGVNGGIPSDLPKNWFAHARIRPVEDKECNYFKVIASQPLLVWQKKGWLHPDDPHGWFQWYCRYYLGRRHSDDFRQVARWNAMNRHVAQIKKYCMPRDLSCRVRQRQALLHWAFDSRLL